MTFSKQESSSGVSAAQTPCLKSQFPRTHFPSETTSTKADQCAWCGKKPYLAGSEQIRLRMCSGCLITPYCNKECQRNHWKIHKLKCKNENRKSKSGHQSVWDLTLLELTQRTEVIQRQHEALRKDLNDVILSLTESLRTFNIPVPKKLTNHKDISSIKSPENMSTLLQRCISNDEKEQLSSTKECRKLLSDQNPPIKELVDMGLIPVFVQFLQNHNNPQLQFEAAWVLTNICSGTSEQTQAVIASGAVSVLISLLSSPDEELSEQCVWALGNIAADSSVCRDILLESGIIEGLIPLMSSTRLTMLKNLSWTMSNLCNGVKEAHWEKITQVLPRFSRLIFYSDEEILKEVCWTLSYISGGTKHRIQAIVELEPSVCRRLVDLLSDKSPSVQHAALIAVGNIVTGDDEQTQILLDHQLLPRLRSLLSHSKTSILKDTCFTLSNIAAGSQSQIQALIEARIIPALILLYTSSKYEIKVEAIWALSNALSNGSDQQIRYLINQGCLKPMADVLTLCDLSTVEAVLEGLEHILRVGEHDFGGSTRNPYLELLTREGFAQKLSALEVSEPVILAKIQSVIPRLSPPNTNSTNGSTSSSNGFVGSSTNGFDSCNIRQNTVPQMTA